MARKSSFLRQVIRASEKAERARRQAEAAALRALRQREREEERRNREMVRAAQAQAREYSRAAKEKARLEQRANKERFARWLERGQKSLTKRCLERKELKMEILQKGVNYV